MKELFTQPEIEIVSYEAVDIICASNDKPTGDDFGPDIDL